MVTTVAILLLLVLMTPLLECLSITAADTALPILVISVIVSSGFSLLCHDHLIETSLLFLGCINGCLLGCLQMLLLVCQFLDSILFSYGTVDQSSSLL